jgi:hypothetical protein
MVSLDVKSWSQAAKSTPASMRRDGLSLMVNVALTTTDAACGFLEMSLQDVLAHGLPCKGSLMKP